MGLHTLQTLIVDDHPFMRQLLGDMVRAAGLRQPVTADNGEQAIDVLMATEIDLLLIDLEMPGMSGLEVARWVRSSPQSRWRALPIIMVTAHTDRPHVERARDAGVTEVVTKPISPQTLLSRLASAIDHPRSFVVSNRYCGPDRRRQDKKYSGSDRRQEESFEID